MSSYCFNYPLYTDAEISILAPSSPLPPGPSHSQRPVNPKYLLPRSTPTALVQVQIIFVWIGAIEWRVHPSSVM